MNFEKPGLKGSGVDESTLPPLTENKEYKRKPHRSFVAVGLMLLLMAVVIGAVGVGVYMYHKAKMQAQVVAVTQPSGEWVSGSDGTGTDIPEIMFVSGCYSGYYGASVVEMNLDFVHRVGTRCYKADPYNKYTLKITGVEPVGNGSYNVEITEYIENRIKVGVFVGNLTDSDFRGEYSSTHGDIREFHFTR